MGDEFCNDRINCCTILIVSLYYKVKIKNLIRSVIMAGNMITVEIGYDIKYESPLVYIKRAFVFGEIMVLFF